MNNINYIVTGCTGFVGNVLTKRLLELNCRVVGFAQNRAKAERVFKGFELEIVYGDITNKEDVAKIFDREGEFVVIHTVAKVAIGGESEAELYPITVEGTKNVVDQCIKHRARKLIHISSTQVVSVKGKKGVIEEIDAPDPKRLKGAYARTKAQADLVVLNAVKEHGLDASILMLSSVIGPGDYSGSHMSQMLVDFMRGKLPASVNAGYNDFDVRDLSEVLPKIISSSRKGEYYFIARKRGKINDILKIAAKKENKKVPVTLPLWIAYVGLPFLSLYNKVCKKRPLYTRTALYCLKCNSDFSIEKARKEFGYSPRPLEETVSDYIDFLKGMENQ